MIKVTDQFSADQPTLDLTPLLDIIFIVMVFLLLTATVKLQFLEVALPSTDESSTTVVDSDSISINILSQAPYWGLDGERFDSWESFTKQLLERVSSANKEAPVVPVVIGADKTAQVQHMVQLFGFLQKNHIEATQILMEEELK
ncbi:ExbD/TolR family protein [Aliivibrio kagoshimensis]|uniref:ExbD/TolR family protein n=1 Tax=Aliivibrio kagoshimensis TaxID=2910230 RepID=UPI003D1430AC